MTRLSSSPSGTGIGESPARIGNSNDIGGGTNAIDKKPTKKIRLRMRIISGRAGGIVLDVPKGSGVRPTGARSREALFDSLGNFDGMMVLDLFAGSGALGLECASRGAARVVFIEKSRPHQAIIKRNIAKVEKTGVECRFDLIAGDAMNAWRRVHGEYGKPDLVLADPPYAVSGVLLTRLAGSREFASFAAGAMVVWEMPPVKSRVNWPDNTGLWELPRLRNYGGTEFLSLTIPD